MSDADPPGPHNRQSASEGGTDRSSDVKGLPSAPKYEGLELDRIGGIALWLLPPLALGVVAAAGHLGGGRVALILGAQLLGIFLLVVGLALYGPRRWLPLAGIALLTVTLLGLLGDAQLDRTTPLGDDAANAGSATTTASISAQPVLRVDLRGQNVSGQNFDGQDLAAADFGSAMATSASFRNANLAGATFSATNLQGADFTGADLRGSDLRTADLSGANLSGTCLVGANLEGANLSNVAAPGADIRGATVPSTASVIAAAWPSDLDISRACGD